MERQDLPGLIQLLTVQMRRGLRGSTPCPKVTLLATAGPGLALSATFSHPFSHPCRKLPAQPASTFHWWAHVSISRQLYLEGTSFSLPLFLIFNAILAVGK